VAIFFPTKGIYSKFESVNVWNSEKIHWISVNIEPLKKFSGAVLIEIQVNFHWISETITDVLPNLR